MAKCGNGNSVFPASSRRTRLAVVRSSPDNDGRPADSSASGIRHSNVLGTPGGGRVARSSNRLGIVCAWRTSMPGHRHSRRMRAFARSGECRAADDVLP